MAVETVLRGGGSMTRVDLTKAQCAELANYLRGVLNNGMGAGSFDKIEMLVLARRALAAAEELPEVPRTVARGSATWKPEKALERDAIASRVRYARTCAGLTQTDASAALGVTPQAISNYERGLTGIPVETLCKMAELYNTSVSSLAGDNGNMPQKPEDASVVDSPASEAAQLKRDTLERLTAYRQKDGMNSLAPLAAACGKVDGKVISAELLARMLNRERFPVAIWREVAAALDKMERKKGADADGKDK